MEGITRNKVKEDKYLNRNFVESEINVKSKSVKQILSELNKYLGISKEDKETIKMYADYIRLRKQNKITVGNANILINCSENRNYKNVITTITKLLYKNGNITYPRYDVFTDVHVGRNNTIDNELYVIDDESLKSYKLDKLLYDNSSAVFIIICNDSNIKEVRNTNNNFYWFINLSEPTKDEKMHYIKDTIKQHNFIAKLNDKELLAMASVDMETIDRYLMNSFIIANKKNLEYISREELNILPKPTKQGLNKLNAMVGLEEVKKQVQHILNYLQIHKNRGTIPSLNMIFKGNPRNR